MIKYSLVFDTQGLPSKFLLYIEFSFIGIVEIDLSIILDILQKLDSKTRGCTSWQTIIGPPHTCLTCVKFIDYV